MSNNTLNEITNGPVTPGDWNQFITALINDFVGRNGLGAPEAGKKLGTPSIPWGQAHIGSLYLNGALFDPDNIGVASGGNGIVSGQTRSGSQQPDYLRASGSAPSFSVLGSTTPLSLNIAGSGVSVSTDLTLGSLSTAPTTNNTALVNDSDLSGDQSSKYAGENGRTIALDSAGSEITDRIGQYAAFKNGTYEILFGRIASGDSGSATAVLDNCYRGFFFDDSGVPIPREGMSNDDTLTLMNLAWVFIQNDGTTLDVSYRTPIWSYSEPTAPVTDDYWFDMGTQLWKRYDGSEFVEINRLFIGWVVLDGTNAIAARSMDFSKAFNSHIDVELKEYTDTQAKSYGDGESISVYGKTISFAQSPVVWDITTNLESGLTEGANQFLYLYITQAGKTVMSEEHPYNRPELHGWYHPYHTWRYVGVCYNDGGSDLSGVNSCNTPRRDRLDVYTSSGQFLAVPNVYLKIICTGGGDGGGTSSFGSLMSATGGSSNITPGYGIGGDINITGGRGGYGGGFTEATAVHLGGDGGGSFWGDGGKGGFLLDGNTGSGGVDDTAKSGTSSSAYGTASGGDYDENGGGGGGTSIKTVFGLPGRHAITVGSSSYGAPGIVTVEYL